MQRLHLFEWEDQPWLPVVLRDFVTDHLRYFLTHKMREPVNRAVAERLKPLLARASSNQIIDLCAGAGGPLLNIRRILAEDLGEPVSVVLTDLYPNVEAFKRRELEGGGAGRDRVAVDGRNRRDVRRGDRADVHQPCLKPRHGDVHSTFLHLTALRGKLIDCAA